jgi:hypothetical protein
MAQIKNRYRLIFLIFLAFSTKDLLAQTTYNPYSMQGLGEIEMGEYGRNSGMAGVSIGMRSPGFLNTSNPASLTTLDSTSFVYDFSSAMKFSNFQSASQNENTYNFNFKKVAMGFKASHRWAISVGLMPYSGVGYKITTTQPVEGTLGSTSNVYYDGNGGINKFYVSNAFQITQKISFGFNSSFLFGSINNNVSVDHWSIAKTSTIQTLYFDFGIQYTDKFKDLANFTIGLVYGYKSPLNLNDNIVLKEDTSTLNKFSEIGSQYLPMFYGLGLSVCLKNKLTLAADYQFQQWSVVTSNFSNVTFADMNKLKFGVEYVPNDKSFISYFERIHYQCGVSIYNSYLNISGEKPIDYMLSLGIGLPIRRSGLMNIAVNYGKFGTTNNLQIQENFTQICLNFSLADIWFVKRKYD